jgi:hypothetical protein
MPSFCGNMYKGVETHKEQRNKDKYFLVSIAIRFAAIASGFYLYAATENDVE